MAKRRAKKREEIVRLFAERLRELRLSRGMTQAELARRAGVSVTYVSQLESADTAPGIDLVARVAKALGITTTELLPPESAPETLAVLKDQAERQFDELRKVGDRQAYLLLNPFLAHLLEAAAKRR